MTSLGWAPNLTPEAIEVLKSLREPFGPESINKLPKGIPASEKNNKRHCDECGGYHGPAKLHLDYVGHAAVTERLLDVDPAWYWEPFAKDEHGAPIFERDGSGKPVGLWIVLFVAGMGRPGYGSVESSKGEAVKELIGDAIRNAAMRFGVALDLWKKDVGSAIQDDDEPAPIVTVVSEGWKADALKEVTAGRFMAASNRVLKEQGRDKVTAPGDVPDDIADAVLERLGLAGDDTQRVEDEPAPERPESPNESGSAAAPANPIAEQPCAKHSEYDDDCMECRWMSGKPVAGDLVKEGKADA